MATAKERNPIRSRGLKLIPVDQQKRHDEWLALRKGYIGGSEAGAIVGLNPYNSAFSVWAEKTGGAAGFEGNTATRVGSYLEDLVSKLFSEETGKTVRRCNFMIVNPAYPFAAANIDREIIGEDAILECKTTTSLGNIRKFRTGEYPEQWYCQITHYLAVTGAQRAYLAALENNLDLHIFVLERDEDEIAALMEAERAFWEGYVLTKKAPPADGHMATTDTLKALYPEDTGEEANLDGLETALEARTALIVEQRALKAEIDALDNQIKARMGNASRGELGRFVVTWRTQRSSGLDREAVKRDFPALDFSKYASQSRVFRVIEKKEKTA